MRKLIAVAALAAVTSASAIGVGFSAHYNIGMPMGDLADGYKMSIMGFQGDLEFAVHPFINVVAAFGYQKFSPSAEGVNENDKFTLIPILFGFEYNAAFGNLVFYPGGGMSYNFMTTTLNGLDLANEKKMGIWFGGNFYYMFNPKMGVGAGVAFHMIFTEVEKTSWIHIPLGFKYWFM